LVPFSLGQFPFFANYRDAIETLLIGSFLNIRLAPDWLKISLANASRQLAIKHSLAANGAKIGCEIV
jgi:hypothetical protein